MNLTDEQWRLIQPLIPASPPKPTRRGRPALLDRHVLDAIFWVRRTGSPWRALPIDYPSYLTCRRREVEWERSGAMDKIMRALLHDLRERGGLDISKCMKDGSINIDGYQLSVADRWKGTWQLATALIIITPIYKKILTRYRRRQYGISG